MRTLCVAGLWLFVASCGDPTAQAVVRSDTPAPVLRSIQVTPTEARLSVGDTARFIAVVKDGVGRPMSLPIRWASSNGAVVRVDSTGLVTGAGGGTALISASADTLTAAATVSVAEKTYELAPELARAYVNEEMPVATGGTIIVPADGDLQAALDTAGLGDVIALANGASYVGYVTLANKGRGSGWIIIRPASMSGMTAEGTRMTPALAAAANLPKIVSPNVMPALDAAASSHHYRFVGLEVTMNDAAGTGYSYGLVTIGTNENSLSLLQHDFVFDRVYLHGLPRLGLQKCLALNSATSAVIDSWPSECHMDGADAQAIVSWNSPGPIKIVNNYLEGSGENVMFGGADPQIVNQLPSDIEIRHNHFKKPLAWKTEPRTYTIKNLLEFKNAQRVLVEGNVFENNWYDGQDGTAILFTGVVQGGVATWSVVQDVTFRYNVIWNTLGGFTAAAIDNGNHVLAKPTQRVTIINNLFQTTQTSPIALYRGFVVSPASYDIHVEHNSFLGDLSLANPESMHAMAWLSQTSRLVIANNIFSPSLYGLGGDDVGSGTAALTRYAPDAVMTGNLIASDWWSGDPSAAYPAGNSFPKLGQIGLNSDLSLSAGSPFRGKGSDGKDPGADIAATLSNTQGVVVP